MEIRSFSSYQTGFDSTCIYSGKLGHGSAHFFFMNSNYELFPLTYGYFLFTLGSFYRAFNAEKYKDSTVISVCIGLKTINNYNTKYVCQHTGFRIAKATHGLARASPLCHTLLIFILFVSKHIIILAIYVLTTVDNHFLRC